MFAVVISFSYRQLIFSPEKNTINGHLLLLYQGEKVHRRYSSVNTVECSSPFLRP